MKSLILLLIFSIVGVVVTLSVTGCAYNSTNITAEGNVTCTASVDKPTSVNPFAGAAVPVGVGAQPVVSGEVSK